jgi:thiamine biosynthesis lipoprotein
VSDAFASEAKASFDCFGSRCAVRVGGDLAGRSSREAVAMVERELRRWHARFSRFLPDSELSQLNRDRREVVPVSPLMALLARAIRQAGSLTGGLVDATLLAEIERAGYTGDLGPNVPLARALELAPPRAPAGASRASRWRAVDVDLDRRTVSRPPGVMLDSGGIAKGLFADALAARLAGHETFAVVCAGDLAIGGDAGAARAVEVESPIDGSVLHSFRLARGGVATSGIGKRSWIDGDGRPAHHLLDPATGRPAFTGLIQATAIAPSALEAEIRAKAALLSGPARAAAWLVHGGVVVADDGSARVIGPGRRATESTSSIPAHAGPAPEPIGATGAVPAGRGRRPARR